MPYLTYVEYQDMLFADVSEEEFPRLLARASDVIDGVTRSFYYFNELTDDVPFRQERFKKAIAAQIEYFQQMGSTSSHGLNTAASVTIGRTSMSNGSRGGTGQAEVNKVLSDDAQSYLLDTGLLYRGVM